MNRFETRLMVPGRIEAVRPAAAHLVNLVRGLKVPAADSTLFENAIVEALNNAVQHMTPGRRADVRCELELTAERLTIRVLDETAAAPVALVQSGAVPADPGTWQEIPERGYGLYLIRAVFSDVRPVTRDGCHGIEMSLAV